MEIINISRRILIRNLTELMMSGTSGRSSALVEVATATSRADDSVENAERRTYVNDVFLASTGTNAAVNFDAAATNMIDSRVPRID